jgi:hypothetical protein
MGLIFEPDFFRLLFRKLRIISHSLLAALAASAVLTDEKREE